MTEEFRDLGRDKLENGQAGGREGGGGGRVLQKDSRLKVNLTNVKSSVQECRLYEIET